jgi:DNA-binding NarL/FixJ family response regulator
MIAEGLSSQYRYIEADSCAGVMTAFSTQRIHCCVLDMSFSDGNVFLDTGLLSAYAGTTDILVYSMNAESVYARRLLQKGVKGFVCKKAGIDELEKAIRCLVDGEIYVSPMLRNTLFGPAGSEGSKNPIDELSDRELEVVEHTISGMSVKEIAHRMSLDITTVSTYRRRAYRKLKVDNLFELKDKVMLYKM